MDFRRRVSTAPEERDAEMRAHAAECPSCEAFAERAGRFDAVLARALRVPVPEGLAARVLLNNAFHDDAAPRASRRRVLAIAAGVLVAGVVAGTAWWATERPDPLAEEIITLVNTATFALEANGPVSDEELESLLAPTGVRLTRPVGEVTFAGPCVVRGKLAGHVVVRGQTAKVTMLFMPRERVTGRSEFSSYHFQGVLLPAEHGAVAIIASPGEPMAGLERRALEAFHAAT